MKKLNEIGFTLIEGLLVLITISIIGGVGFYIYNANNKEPLKTSENSQPSSSEPESKTAEASNNATFTDKEKAYSFVLPKTWKTSYSDYVSGPGRAGSYSSQYLQITSEDFQAAPKDGNSSIATISKVKLDGTGLDQNNRPINNLNDLIELRRTEFAEDGNFTNTQINGANVWRIEQNTKNTSATGPPEQTGAYKDIFYLYSKNNTDVVELTMRVTQTKSVNYKGDEVIGAFDNSKYLSGFEEIAKSIKLN